MKKELEGPKYKSTKNKIDSVCIFLHGYGSDGNDLIEMAPYIASNFPSMLFLSPNAPEVCIMNPQGRQWFNIDKKDERVDDPDEVLKQYIEKQKELYGIKTNKIFLFGFSQGAMVALHIGLRYKETFAGILSFSGAVVAPTRLDQIMNTTPVLMVHGEDDNVVLYSELQKGSENLKKSNIEVSTLSIPNLGHGIDQLGISKAVDFMKLCLKI